MCRGHLKYGTGITKITHIHTLEQFSQKNMYIIRKESNDESVVGVLFVFIQKQDEYTNSGVIRQLSALGEIVPVQFI